MEEKRVVHSKPRVVRKLYSCEERLRPWLNTSDSDTSQSDSNNETLVRTHRGYCSDSSPCKYLPPIGVFWDIENCQIPRGRSAVAVAQAIRDKFFDGYREAEFLVVCDVKKETSQVIQELNDAQVNMIHVGSQCKNAADEKLRQSIRRFADIHGSMAAIVLISGDINFAPDLCDLRHRKKIHVILVHSDSCSESLILCANQHFHFSAIVANLPFRGEVKSVYQPAELRVSALPLAYDPAKVRLKLKRLTENCGGKVSEVVGDNAMVRFTSIEAAMRAHKRMEGEKIFGSQIVIGQPTVVKNQKLKESPIKGYHRRTNARRDDDRWNIPGFGEQTEGTFYSHSWNDTLPNCSRFYGNIQSQRRPFYNQENLPLSARHFFSTTPQQVRLKQTSRQILGNRGENTSDNFLTMPAASGRHSLDSMLDGADFEGETKPIWTVSRKDEWTSQCSQEIRKCRTPSPHLQFTVNTSLPPPPIINLPQKDDTQHVLQPIPVKPVTKPTDSVDMIVTNLDQSIDIVQMKNELAAAFSKCCSVMNVSVFLQTEGTLAAIVRVRSQMDAANALKTMEKRMIGLRQISVALAPATQENTAATGVDSNKLVASPILPCMLLEGGKQPDLSQCAVHSRDVTESVAESVLSVTIRLGDLAVRLAELIKSHDNHLPLASLPDCYAAKYQQFCLGGPSVPLEHLVTCVRNVELVKTACGKHLQFSSLSVKKQTVQGGVTTLLGQLGQELTELLRNQVGCQIMFNRLAPAYRQHFGKHIRVADYGCCKLIDLLENLPDVIQVMGEGNGRMVTLTHRAQIERFSTDLLKLVKSQSSKQLSLQELPTVWERTLGHKLESTDYGLCYTEDLLSQVPDSILLITKHQDETIISIPRRPQTLSERERTRHFAVQVVELLCKTPHFTLDFTKFIPTYHQHFKKQCKVADYGFTKLVELFEAISYVVKVEGEGENGRQLTLTLSERLKLLSQQIADLVVPRFPPGLSLHNLNSAYLWQFSTALRPADFECSTLSELINKLPTVKVVTSGGCVMVIPASCSWGKIQLLRTLRILWERSSGRMNITEFEQLYLRYYQNPPSRFSLFTELKSVVKVTEDSNIQLTSLQLFARDVYRLLYSYDGRLALPMLDPAMKRVLDTTVTPGQYGCQTVEELLKAVDHVVHITGRGNKRLLVLNTQLAEVGIPLPSDFGKILSQSSEITSPSPSDVQTHQASSQQLLEGLYNKKASSQKGLTLLSPAEFLQPCNALPLQFIPSPPSPSALPKPGNFDLTQDNKQSWNLLMEEPVASRSNASDFRSELQIA
uniref:HTH OST-type domain-containing protein n=1 Tax=Homalodisca liturata TaxID=320908 RepID=A0A1B6J5V4_9HEMI